MKTTRIILVAGIYSAAIAAATAGLVNGDFESPVLGNGITIVAGGEPAGFGWTVAAGSVDLVHTYWQPASGNQSLDLDGVAAGTIYQDFTFDTAGTWSIQFAMSANPDSSGDKTMQVSFGSPSGPLTTLGTYTLSSNGRTESNMQWVTMTTPSVTAQTGVLYRLEFTSLTPGAYGPALDNIQLVPVPEPSCLSVLACGVLFACSRLSLKVKSLTRNRTSQVNG